MHLRRVAVPAAIVLAALVFQYALAGQFELYAQRVLAVCGTNVMLAVALNLVTGTTGQFSIGHAGFMALGAYGAALTSAQIDAPIHARFSGDPADLLVLLVALAVGALCAAVAGVVVGVPSLRLRGDYLAIVTLGFGEIIRISLESTSAVGGAQGFPVDGVIPRYASVAWIWMFAALTIFYVGNLTYSTHGRALVAIREDEIAAEASGIPTTRYKVLAFAISAAIAGMAGGLFAHDATGGQHIDPNAFRMDRSIDMLVMIIFGGLGSITGAVVGGVLVALSLEALSYLASQLPDTDSVVVHLLRENKDNLRLVLFALTLIVLMLQRPQGIFGTREVTLRALRRLLPGPGRSQAGGAA